MAFTKVTAAGIGSTETVTLDGLSVINNGSFGGNLTVSGVLTYEDVTNVDSVGLITARNGVVVGSGITLSKDGDIFATGVTTSTTFVGNLTGNVTGNSDTATNSTNASHVLVTDNESTNENNLITFVEDATSSTGNVGLEMDGNLTYNPSTGTVSATAFSGDGSALTGIGGTDFIHAEQISTTGIVTATSFAPTVGQFSHRNLVINGAMNVAERGTSSDVSSTAYGSVDRFQLEVAGLDNAVTMAQVDVSSGTTPYTEGFRKALKLTNGDQTSVGNTDTMRILYKFEGQDIAQSGWNHKSSSSFITFSF